MPDRTEELLPAVGYTRDHRENLGEYRDQEMVYRQWCRCARNQDKGERRLSSDQLINASQRLTGTRKPSCLRITRICKLIEQPNIVLSTYTHHNPGPTLEPGTPQFHRLYLPST